MITFCLLKKVWKLRRNWLWPEIERTDCVSIMATWQLGQKHSTVRQGHSHNMSHVHNKKMKQYRYEMKIIQHKNISRTVYKMTPYQSNFCRNKFLFFLFVCALLNILAIILVVVIKSGCGSPQSQSWKRSSDFALCSNFEQGFCNKYDKSLPW